MINFSIPLPKGVVTSTTYIPLDKEEISIVAVILRITSCPRVLYITTLSTLSEPANEIVTLDCAGLGNTEKPVKVESSADNKPSTLY